jgi:hypothetical protein
VAVGFSWRRRRPQGATTRTEGSEALPSPRHEDRVVWPLSGREEGRQATLRQPGSRTFCARAGIVVITTQNAGCANGRSPPGNRTESSLRFSSTSLARVPDSLPYNSDGARAPGRFGNCREPVLTGAGLLGNTLLTWSSLDDPHGHPLMTQQRPAHALGTRAAQTRLREFRAHQGGPPEGERQENTASGTALLTVRRGSPFPAEHLNGQHKPSVGLWSGLCAHSRPCYVFQSLSHTPHPTVGPFSRTSLGPFAPPIHGATDGNDPCLCGPPADRPGQVRFRG